MTFEPFFSRVKLNRDRDRGRAAASFQFACVTAIESLLFDRSAIFLVDENGSGESTLVEALAMGFNVEGGTKRDLGDAHPAP